MLSYSQLKACVGSLFFNLTLNLDMPQSSRSPIIHTQCAATFMGPLLLLPDIRFLSSHMIKSPDPSHCSWFLRRVGGPCSLCQGGRL